MHYTCELVLRLLYVNAFWLLQYLYLLVCIYLYVLLIPLNRWYFYSFLHMYYLYNFIVRLDILQSKQVYYFCCLQSYQQQHCEQLIGFPSPQSLFHFTFMSLTLFELISLEKKIIPYFPSLQLSLTNFLHLRHPSAFSDSCNLPRPLTPPIITLCLKMTICLLLGRSDPYNTWQPLQSTSRCSIPKLSKLK